MAHSYTTSKKENELKVCLSDLKNYCLQLDEKMERRLNGQSWNYLIQQFAKQNEFEDLAIHWYKNIMLDKKLANPNSFTLGSVLRILSNRGELEKCEEIHKILIERKKYSLYTYTQYVNACSKRDELEKGLNLILEMKRNGIEPNYGIFIPMLKAATLANNIEIGLRLLELIENSNTISIQVSMCVITFSLVAKKPEKTIEECKKLKQRKLMTVVTWTCLMQAYIQMNQVDKAIQLLDDMKNDGIQPNSTTFTILITACANQNLFEQGEYLHSLSLRLLDNTSIELTTAIMNFYTKCNQPEKAIEECKKIQDKGLMNVVSWTCLIHAHIQAADITAAIHLFEQMKRENVEPNNVTFTILLSGCGDFVSQEKGLSVIDEIKRRGLDTSEEMISSMMNFYSKIGDKSSVANLFKSLQHRKDAIFSIITYNNMLSHYAHHGNGVMAKNIFDGMVTKNIQPNDQTFTIVLNAFSHSGMAIKFFNDLQLVYNHKPSLFNIAAMVDVYSRAGLFDQAETLIGNRMDFILWNTLMGGCRKFNNIQIGERVFSKLTSEKKNEASPYILLSHIYTYHGLNEKAEIVRNLMAKNGIKKIPGIVYHEEDGHTYKFISGSTDYERYEEVERMREKIYKRIIRAGFQPDTKWVTNTKSLTEQEKIDALCKHAEKTAIAHALVLNPKRKKILLTKNLRVCNDCHNATEYISKVFKIEIIVRDANRYHHFVNGKCSCNNYW